MIEWIDTVINSPELNLMIIPALFFLGIISSIGSFGCSIPALGLVAGYAGAGKSEKKRDNIFLAVGFILGVVLSLTVTGFIIGHTGNIISGALKNYSRIIAGLVAIFFGLMTLDLLPFKLPAIKPRKHNAPRGLAGALVLGAVTGSVMVACTMTCCSPVLPILFGVAGIQGSGIRSALVMGVFGLGFSIPLTAVLLGISFGSWALRANKLVRIIRKIAGILLLVVGFYFLKG